jgi:two-component system response regulator DesR
VPAHDAEEAFTAARRYQPHVVIVDLELADGRGVEVARGLRAAAPSASLVVLSGPANMSLSTAKSIGASALLPKRTQAADLVHVVRCVAAGGHFFPRRQTDVAALTPRQSQVLALMADGGTNQEIAARLHLSPETVKHHATAIYRKLGVRNRTQAARRGGELGLTVIDRHANAAAA